MLFKAHSAAVYGINTDASIIDFEVVWKQEDQGQWIALIRFKRQFDPRLNSGWSATEIRVSPSTSGLA
ncbi:MAG: hypothetical protein ACLQGT_09850 [Terracidiphilus sp.]